MAYVIRHGIVVALLLTAIGCVNTQKHWKAARLKNSIEAYESFAAKYPAGPFAESAKLAIERLRFQLVESTNTVSAYESFLSANPGGHYRSLCVAWLDSFYFSRAESLGTPEGYLQYLQECPQGTRMPAAPMRVTKLIPSSLDYDGSDVAILYDPSGDLVRLLKHGGIWRVTKSEVGDSIRPGRVYIMGNVRAGTNLTGSSKGASAGKGGAMISVSARIE